MRSVAILKTRMHGQGGLEKWTERLTRAFAARGCPVTLLSSDPCTFDSPLIKTATLPCRGLFPYQRIDQFDKKVAHFLQKHPSDIVFGMDRNRRQTHYRAGNGVHKAYLERRRETASKLKAHSFAVNPLHRLLLEIEKKAFENPALERLFTNSEMVRREILTHYDTDPNKVTVVHNGTDWHGTEKEFALWVEKKSRICAANGLDPAAFHFLFIGNGYERKGLDLLLDALPKEAHLSVIGRDKNLDKYIQLAHKKGLGARVHFFGERRDVRAFYQIADCVVVPSTYDPFANVTIEALAMGCTVVSSQYNGGAEILTPETGLIIEELFDRDAFHKALVQAMQSPKTWVRSRHIRDSVKHLDIENQLSQIIDLTLGKTE